MNLQSVMRRAWPSGLTYVAAFVLAIAVIVMPFRWPRMFRAVVVRSVLLLPLVLLVGTDNSLVAPGLLICAWRLSGRKELWVRQSKRRPGSTPNALASAHTLVTPTSRSPRSMWPMRER